MSLSFFSKDAWGNIKKSCDECLLKKKKYNGDHKKQRREKYLANRDKRKEYQKNYSKQHKRQVQIHNMIANTRREDKKYNRYDADNHVTPLFITSLYNEQKKKCIYCERRMKFKLEAYAKLCVSLERKDNSIGHTQNNCVLACLECNLQRQNLMSFEDYKIKKQNSK